MFVVRQILLCTFYTDHLYQFIQNMRWLLLIQELQFFT